MWLGSWPTRVVTTHTLEPTGASAGTVVAAASAPSLSTLVFSDDMAGLNTPSTEPQTNRLCVSLKSVASQEVARLMLEPTGMEEPADGVPVTCRDPLWACPR